MITEINEVMKKMSRNLIKIQKAFFHGFQITSDQKEIKSIILPRDYEKKKKQQFKLSYRFNMILENLVEHL